MQINPASSGLKFQGASDGMKLSHYGKVWQRLTGQDPLSEYREKVNCIEDPEAQEFLVELWNNKTAVKNVSDDTFTAALAGMQVAFPIVSFPLGLFGSVFTVGGSGVSYVNDRSVKKRQQSFDKMFAQALKAQNEAAADQEKDEIWKRNIWETPDVSKSGKILWKDRE